MMRKLATLVGVIVSSSGCDLVASDELDLVDVQEDQARSEMLADPSIEPSLFVMGNAADGNEVLAFRRTVGGRPVLMGSYPTGGLGTGARLGSQGSVVLDASGQWLFVVNAGSDEISVFEVTTEDLVLRDIVPSGGDRPVSLTVHDDVLYVLHTGNAAAQPATLANIVGFKFDEGHLKPIPGSRRRLSLANPSPAQVGFSPDGTTLVVTERGTQRLLAYPVDDQGVAGMPTGTSSNGMTPFGFEFVDDSTFVVAEAFGGAPGASAASSYRIKEGVPVLISASVPTEQTSASWVAVSRWNDFVYTINTAGDSITGFSVADGTLAGLGDGGATALPGDGPTDAAFSRDGRFLYVINDQTDSLGVMHYLGDGSLDVLADMPGLPASALGIAVR